MMTSGGTILVTIPVLTMIIDGAGKCTVMILTAGVFTVSSRCTVCTVPIATTAGTAATAPGHSR